MFPPREGVRALGLHLKKPLTQLCAFLCRGKQRGQGAASPPQSALAPQVRVMVTHCPALGQLCWGVESPPPPLTGRRDTSFQDGQNTAEHASPRGQHQTGGISAPSSLQPQYHFPASAPAVPSSNPGRNTQPWPVAAGRDLSDCAPGTISTTWAMLDRQREDQSSEVRYPGMTYRGITRVQPLRNTPLL